jgi:hypothetical protein
LDLLTPYTHHSELHSITVLSAVIPAIYKSQQHPLGISSLLSSPVVSWQRIYNSFTVTAAYIKSSFHSKIPFFPFLLNYIRLPTQETQSQSQTQNQSYFTTGGLPPINLSWRQAP